MAVFSLRAKAQGGASGNLGRAIDPFFLASVELQPKEYMIEGPLVIIQDPSRTHLSTDEIGIARKIWGGNKFVLQPGEITYVQVWIDTTPCHAENGRSCLPSGGWKSKVVDGPLAPDFFEDKTQVEWSLKTPADLRGQEHVTQVGPLPKAMSLEQRILALPAGESSKLIGIWKAKLPPSPNGEVAGLKSLDWSLTFTHDKLALNKNGVVETCDADYRFEKGKGTFPDVTYLMLTNIRPPGLKPWSYLALHISDDTHIEAITPIGKIPFEKEN